MILGKSLVEALVVSGSCASKSEARRDIQGGGVYVNNLRETDPQRPIGDGDLLFCKHLLFRKGKKNYVVVTAK